MILKFIRAHSDWFVASGVIVAAIALVVIIVVISQSNPSPEAPKEEVFSGTYDIEAKGIQAIIPPAHEFPIKGEQRGFYTPYTQGDVQYSIERKVTNISREPAIGNHEFEVKLRNTTNKRIDAQSELLAAISIGCVATDKPYRLTSFKPAPISPLEPLEVRKTILSINATCLYLGTADSKHFWRIY